MRAVVEGQRDREREKKYGLIPFPNRKETKIDPERREGKK